jgi:hypothetical protein
MGIKRTRVGLSRWLIAYIVVRLRELYGLADDTPLDITIVTPTAIDLTYEEYCELHGIGQFLKAVETIHLERQSMAHFFICAAHGFRLASPRIQCPVQSDVESHGASADISNTFADNAAPIRQGTKNTGSNSTEVSNATNNSPLGSHIEPVICGHDVC